jgi:hypothetical protein
VNALVPFTLGAIVRIFEEKSERSPWLYIFAYAGLRFLQSSGGLAAFRNVRCPIRQPLEPSQLLTSRRRSGFP